VIASKALGTASTVDISSLATAENAVTALTNAVSTLGKAQAAVGKGENLFNYAIQLAQSQVTNQVPPNPASATPTWLPKLPT